MHEFTIVTLSKLGANDPTYGQKYWATVHETQMPVSFNSKQEVAEGQKVQAEEYTIKKSAKGTDYQQLKKVKVVGSSDNTSQGTTGKPQTRQFKADPDKQAEIKAEWAIGKVVETIGLDDLQKVEEKAKALHAMVDRLKANGAEGSPEPLPEQPKDEVVDTFDESKPINLDDIPF